MTNEERKALVERLRDGRWKGETTCGPAADQIEADGKRIAALEAALRNCPIIGQGETVAGFRERQDKWLRDVYGPALGETK